MKIAILSDGIPPEGKGGAERVAWQSALMLSKAGHEVFVITTMRSTTNATTHVEKGTVSKKENGVTVSEREGITVFSIPSTYHVRWRAWVSLYNPRVVREVRHILAEKKPDIVHVHNPHEHLSYAVMKVAEKSGAKVFHTAHDVMAFHYGKLASFVDPKNPVCMKSYDYRVTAWQQMQEYRLRYNPLRSFFIRRALKHADTIFAVSHALQDALTQNGIQNVEVLYNGIDADEWKVSKELVEDFKESRGLKGKKVILFGGRVTGTKGGDALLAALPRIIEKVPEAVLLIMGIENDYIRSMKVRADAESTKDQKSVGTSIIVTGWISGDTLRAAYHAADVLVAPSVYLDPLPTVVLEAMACAKPVIGSCFGGIPEMIEDGVTGYVVQPLLAEALAEKISDLLKDETKSHEFGLAGAERQHDSFSEQNHVQLLIQAYQKALQ